MRRDLAGIHGRRYARCNPSDGVTRGQMASSCLQTKEGNLNTHNSEISELERRLDIADYRPVTVDKIFSQPIPAVKITMICTRTGWSLLKRALS